MGILLDPPSSWYFRKKYFVVIAVFGVVIVVIFIIVVVIVIIQIGLSLWFRKGMTLDTLEKSNMREDGGSNKMLIFWLLEFGRRTA